VIPTEKVAKKIYKKHIPDDTVLKAQFKEFEQLHTIGKKKKSKHIYETQ
jgi:hypothetical protein